MTMDEIANHIIDLAERIGKYWERVLPTLPGYPNIPSSELVKYDPKEKDELLQFLIGLGKDEFEFVLALKNFAGRYLRLNQFAAELESIRSKPMNRQMMAGELVYMGRIVSYDLLQALKRLRYHGITLDQLQTPDRVPTLSAV